MSGPFEFRCVACGNRHEAAIDALLCENCGGPYEVVYDSPPLSDRPRLPLGNPENALSLGEGGTPVLELPRLARELGLGAAWAKLEFAAPTGSFKDRGTAVMVSAAREYSVEECVEDSSGNAGASLAAYAAAAGISAHIFVPASAPTAKKDQIRIYGAQLHEVEGPRQAATDAAAEFVAASGLVWLSHALSPFFAEGMKAFAYEVDAGPAERVDHVLFPVGNGSLIIGMASGLREMSETRGESNGPRLHCVQAKAVSPIIAAIDGEGWSPEDATPTVAGGIAVASPPRLAQVVDAVRSSGGSGVAVDDESTIRWQRWLARNEGIFCEATSAAAFAGLEALCKSGVVAPGDSVLVPVTGSGLKEPLPAE